MQNLIYAERYVAFVDILGFKNLIDRSVTNPPGITLPEIIEALKFTQPTGPDKIVLGRIGDISRSNHQMSSFSDCVFISTDSTENGLMNIVHHVEQISFKLFKLGFLCRGGITKGLCYHHDNIIFGPAVIEAHDIEQKLSKYPRVVLSEKVVIDGQKTLAPINEIFNRFVKRDHDSRYFVHYLKRIRLFSDSMEREQPKVYLTMLEKMERKIEEELLAAMKDEKNSHKSDIKKVPQLEKLNWIKEYFKFATDRSHLDMLNMPYPSKA